MKEIQGLLDYLPVLLRYIASGVIAVITLGYLNDQCHEYFLSLFLTSPWFIVAIAGTFGLVIYALHQALLDKTFYFFCIWLYTCRYNKPTNLELQINEWLTSTRRNTTKINTQKKRIRNIRFGLFSQTYLRRSNNTDEIKCIQAEMEKKLTLLNFLYCTFYSLFFIAILLSFVYFFVYNHSLNKDIFIYKFHKWRFIGIIALSIIILVAAILLDYRITKREMWVVNNYFQECLQNNILVEFKIPKEGSQREAIIVGNFNGWIKNVMQLEGNNWVFRIDLHKQEIRYKYIIDGSEVTKNTLESTYWIEAKKVFERKV